MPVTLYEGRGFSMSGSNDHASIIVEWMLSTVHDFSCFFFSLVKGAAPHPVL